MSKDHWKKPKPKEKEKSMKGKNPFGKEEAKNKEVPKPKAPPLSPRLAKENPVVANAAKA